MAQSSQNNSSPPLQMLLQYQVLKWALLIATPVTFMIVIFILISYPPDRKLMGAMVGLSLVCYYLLLYFFAFRRVSTMRGLDLLSACLLSLPTLANAWTIYQHPGDDLSGVVVGLLIVASLSFTSNWFFVVFTFASVWSSSFACLSAGSGLSHSFWMNVLFVAPGIAFITRVVVQTNYNLLLERLNSEKKLSTELASTEDALKVSRKDQEQSQFDLRQRELQLSTLLSNAPLILCVMDKNGVYTQSRGQGLSKLGLAGDEIVGQQFRELYKDHPKLLVAFEKARQGESSQVRVSFAPGLTHQLQYCPVIGKDQDVVGVLGVGFDVSESVLAEHQRMELESQLLQAQKMESLGLLASGVAHDFNNYLGAIIAFCELWEQPPVSNDSQFIEQPEIPVEIKKIAMNAAGVCEQMLMLAGKSSHEKMESDLSSLVREMNQFFRAIVSKEIELSFDLARDPIPIIANRLLIQQSIVNLIKNACEAIKVQPKQGKILISTRVVDGLPTDTLKGIRMGELDPLREKDTFALLTIKDNGCGIDKTDLQRVFEPYFSNKSNGHGFGLAVTAGIVKNHNGLIYCDSDSSGTRIDLVFPVGKTTQIPVSQTNHAPHFATQSSKRILLVDDETMITQSIGLALRGIGYELTTANSGASGLELIDSGEEYDCIIVDFSMPEMNGLEFLSELSLRHNSTPAIMCSGFVELPKNGKVLPSAMLRKPYSISQLEETISKVCAGRADNIVK